MLFGSKFIDVSNLGGAFFMLLWRCHKEVFYIVVGAFHRYYLFCLRTQKRLVTVLFLEFPLLTSSEICLLQIES